MGEYIPEVSYSKFPVDTSGGSSGRTWDPYPQYLLPEELTNYQSGGVPYAGLPAGTTLMVNILPGGTWPARPTARTDLRVHWVGGATDLDAPPGRVSGDVWDRQA